MGLLGRRINFITFSFLIVCSLFTGCAVKTKKSDDKIIRLSVWASEQEEKLLTQMVKSFEKNYEKDAKFEITICSESESTCKDTVLLSPAAAGDVFYFPDDQFLALAQAGALSPVIEHAKEIIDANGGPSSPAVKAASVNGTLYAYPCTASNGYFLYYNAHYIDPARVNSLESILEMCAEKNKLFGMEITSGWYLYGFFKGVGFDVHKNLDDITNYCDWNETVGNVSGVDLCQKLLDISQHDGFTNVNNDELLEGIANGTIIAAISGTWNANVIQNYFGKGYAATKLPEFTVNGEAFQMHSAIGYKLVGVNKHSKNREWSMRLAEWITNESNQLLRFRIKEEAPSNYKASKNDAIKTSMAIMALTEQSEFGHIQNVADSYWNATHRFGSIIASGNIQNFNLQTIMDNLVEEIGNKGY